ncbi:MAG: hypothetical protein WD669_08940 [Pirellulales bacterium]
MNIRINLTVNALALAIAFSGITSPSDHIRAANYVRTIATPDGGQPMAAKADSQGTIHLLYHSADGPRYSRSIDNGKSFSVAIQVVDRPSRKPGLEFTVWDMAVAGNGRVHVALGTNAWSLKLPQEEWGFYYTQLGPSAQAFSPVQNINHKPSEGFSLAADDNGRVTACWLSGKLYANLSRDHGTTFGPAVEIDPACNPCDCCTTSSVYGSDGKLAVLYREETGNERDMYLVRWDQVDNKTTRTRASTTLWKIDGCPMTYFSLSRNADGFVAAWPTKGQVYFARLDAQGDLQPPGEVKSSGTTGMRVGVLALSDAKGTTLLAWKDLGQVRWQLYDRQGQPLGRPASAESAGNGVAGVLDKDGDFIIFR